MYSYKIIAISINKAERNSQIQAASADNLFKLLDLSFAIEHYPP